MFDNLIGQHEAKSLLEGDLRGGRLPPSILLAGPPASGKLTAALEIARVLSCESDDPGAWNCRCASCASHRFLAHPDLLLFGRRSFPEEIPAALDTLAAAPGKAGSYFFVRAVRKLVKRFEPVLWEGEESKLAKATPLVADLEERLARIDPEGGMAGLKGSAEADALVSKTAEDILPIAVKLETFVPDMPPVAQVRAMEWWTRLAPWGRRKTVVIENADAMNESARNALLKILEEPPSSVTIVLASARRQAIMLTILSRVRSYVFVERGADAAKEVLAKVFRADVSRLEGLGPAVLTPERWLASKRAFPPEAARRFGTDFVAAVLAERLGQGHVHGPAFAEAGETAASEGTDIAASLAAILSGTKDLGQKDEAFANSFEAILSAAEDSLSETLRSRDFAPEDLSWMTESADILRETRRRREEFNLPAATLLETTAYRLRDLGPERAGPAISGTARPGKWPGYGMVGS